MSQGDFRSDDRKQRHIVRLINSHRVSSRNGAASMHVLERIDTVFVVDSRPVASV